MQITTATPSVAPVRARPGAEAPRHHGIFPPRDADAETYRAWIAASPWPEVVFAAAGAR